MKIIVVIQNDTKPLMKIFEERHKNKTGTDFWFAFFSVVICSFVSVLAFDISKH